LRTKKLFDNPEMTSVEALVDDDVCVNNLQRLARSLKAHCEVQDKKGYFAITLQRGAKAEAAGTPPTHTHEAVVGAGTAQTPGAVGTVIFLAKDTFGEGDPEFSKTLTNLFLQTLFESGHRPRAILMANTGVRLMAKDSAALKVLNDFKNEGVEVLACGLCVDFYKLKDEIPKEQITNMFAICEYLFAADKIIQP
jgi:tRNA 2-thiouridine synthesizing protein A